MARPPSFDPDQALDAALHLFWRRGWAATSIDELVAATGVPRYSLYARWTDKRGLYLAALDRYLGAVASAWLVPLRDDDDPVRAVRAVFRGLRDVVVDDPERLGCFVLNTMIELGHDPEMHAVVRGVLDQVQGAWRDTLARAVHTGQLPPDEPVEARAAHLAMSMQALLLQARAAPSPEAIDQFVALTLAFLPQE
ncbi:MAG: TetR/AcrR family transcriptional regulator [Myxococcota bacterium]